MSAMTPTMYEVEYGTGGLERLDLFEWGDVHDAIMGVLKDLDASVRRSAPTVRVTSGRNASGAWELFSFRVYRSATEADINPVVVGITCAANESGHVLRADVCGEAPGDVLLELPERAVVGQLSVLEAARDLAESLAGRPDVVVAAFGDPTRRVD